MINVELFGWAHLAIAAAVGMLLFLIFTPTFSESWMRRILWEVRIGRKSWAENFWIWTAQRLPRSLVLWTTIRLMNHGTTGKWGETQIPEVRAVTLLKRWDEPNV